MGAEGSQERLEGTPTGSEEWRGRGRLAPWYGWLGAVVGEGQGAGVGVHLEEGRGGGDSPPQTWSSPWSGELNPPKDGCYHNNNILGLSLKQA